MTKVNETTDIFKAVGRRKRASARVWMRSGTGAIAVNGKPLAQYFPNFAEQEQIRAPLLAVGKAKDFDLTIKVAGGGKQGQAGAVALGVARSLLKYNAEWRKTLRLAGLLTRDARIKERKKFGLKKARRAPQWSKR